MTLNHHHLAVGMTFGRHAPGGTPFLHVAPAMTTPLEKDRDTHHLTVGIGIGFIVRLNRGNRLWVRGLACRPQQVEIKLAEKAMLVEDPRFALDLTLPNRFERDRYQQLVR